MLDKKKLQYRLKRLRQVKTWQLLVILFIGLIVTATLLRLNNLGMIERRQAVIDADARLDRPATRKALVDLQHYVSSHMNTSLSGGVYLNKTYETDRDEAMKHAEDTNDPATAVYQQAAVECRSRFHGGVESYRNDYVACVLERVGSLSPGHDAAASLNLPLYENYRYDFASPLWTPDAAGFAALFCALVLLLIISRLVTLLVLRMLIRVRFKNI